MPGTTVQCAEYVPLAVKKYVPLEKGAVVQRINNLATYIEERLCSTLAGPGYILDRRIFDCSLIRSAANAGAVFQTATRAIGKTDRGVIVRLPGNENVHVKCRVIIGADGPRSTVGKWMQSENRQFMLALQYRLPLCRPQLSTDIYFKPEYRGGYGWVFPKGDYANVGVGVNLSQKDILPETARDFICRLVKEGKLLTDTPAAKTGGLIPVGGPLLVTQKDNMLLTGDAAGLTHPVTGGGIMNAIVSGQMAGETAARAVKNDDLTLLSEYPRQWKSFLGRHLEQAARQKKDLDENWTSDAREFEILIRRNWIGFRGTNGR
jgi:geranylgeranyl reductase family protein